MPSLTKISSTVLIMALVISFSYADTDTDTVRDRVTDTLSNDSLAIVVDESLNSDISPITTEVIQKPTSTSHTTKSFNKFLPTMTYNTDNLSTTAQKVNNASWTTGTKIDRSLGTKIQALLNWHQNGVGAVDGHWGKNTRKAMQAFQMAQGLNVTDTLNEDTWQALTTNGKLATQPVLVHYQLSADDMAMKITEIPAQVEDKTKLEGMYYESLIEGLAEKFHMSESYLQALNANVSFEAGATLTVYNTGSANTKMVSHVIADKTTETLYAYDEADNLIASYPTTVGSIATPSPTGVHTVKTKVYEPNYTYTHTSGSKSIIPAGPNNPVGLVWIGLSKPSYGIHGSPNPAGISRQASAGCVRLTNWDALALLGTIKNGATVTFQ